MNEIFSYAAIGFIAGYVLTKFWQWFCYSSTMEAIWNFFYTRIHKNEN